MEVTLKDFLRVGSDAFEDKARYPAVKFLYNKETYGFDPILLAQTTGGQRLKNSIGNSQFGKDAAVVHIDDFYVRLQGKTIFLTETETDTAVIGAINIKTIKDSSVIALPLCFEISDGIDDWTLCAADETVCDKWVCGLKTALGEKCDTTPGVDVVKTTKVI